MEYKHGRGLIRINKSSISKPYNIKELFTRTHIEVKKEKNNNWRLLLGAGALLSLLVL